MKKKARRPKRNVVKIGLAVSEEILRDARVEAERTCRTLSGFFEFAARSEIDKHKEL